MAGNLEVHLIRKNTDTSRRLLHLNTSLGGRGWRGRGCPPASQFSTMLLLVPLTASCSDSSPHVSSSFKRFRQSVSFTCAIECSHDEIIIHQPASYLTPTAPGCSSTRAKRINVGLFTSIYPQHPTRMRPNETFSKVFSFQSSNQKSAAVLQFLC